LALRVEGEGLRLEADGGVWDYLDRKVLADPALLKVDGCGKVWLRVKLRSCCFLAQRTTNLELERTRGIRLFN
jgi:hypothetical protein